MIRLQDIAEMAGVSRTTVSNVINLLRKVNNYFYLFYFLSQNIFAYHK